MLTLLQLVLVDAALTFLAVIVALMLRLEIIYVGYFIGAIWPFILLDILLRPFIFYLTGIYKHIWRYAKTRDFLNLVFSVFLGSLVLAPITLFWLYPHWMDTFPRSLLVIEGLISLLFLGAMRVGLKIFEHYPGDKISAAANLAPPERALIVGAGSAGALIVQELRANLQLELIPVAFLDDDPSKINRKILGLNVYGPREHLPEIVTQQRIEVVVIAMPSAPGDAIRAIIELCEGVGVPSKIIPGLFEILSGRVSISRLRPVHVGDLLRRDPVKVNTGQVNRLLAGKRVLVTGAGGSIGSELCSQILAAHPAQLVALGHGENSLYSLQAYLAQLEIPRDHIFYQVADVRDRDRLQAIFTRFRPQIIFHAAAHKHVPLMEDNLEDAVTNNIIGTWNLVQMSIQHKVERFVLISTDKAVQPVNIMGMTKHIAERIVRLAAAQTGRPYVSVRFGNVLGSRGSITPLFQRQIASGGPVTITHPEMERYFMTIPEAVQLVLQASTLGQNGEVFVLDMGEPVNITDLARDMIELSGYKVGEDIQIEYTGLRPGERLSESLFSQDENCSRTQHKKIFVARNGIAPSLDAFTREIQSLEQLAKAGQTAELRQKLESLTASPELEPHRT